MCVHTLFYDATHIIYTTHNLKIQHKGNLPREAQKIVFGGIKCKRKVRLMKKGIVKEPVVLKEKPFFEM